MDGNALADAEGANHLLHKQDLSAVAGAVLETPPSLRYEKKNLRSEPISRRNWEANEEGGEGGGGKYLLRL